MHNRWHGRQSVSECFECCLCDLDIFVLDAHEDASQDDFLQLLLEIEIEFFESLADETNGQDWYFFDDKVLTSDVLCDFLSNIWPLVSRNFNAAYSCDDLNKRGSTLAAALRMILFWSIIILRIMSLKAFRFWGSNLCHRYESVSWIKTIVLLVWERQWEEFLRPGGVGWGVPESEESIHFRGKTSQGFTGVAGEESVMLSFEARGRWWE